MQWRDPARYRASERSPATNRSSRQSGRRQRSSEASADRADRAGIEIDDLLGPENLVPPASHGTISASPYPAAVSAQPPQLAESING